MRHQDVAAGPARASFAGLAGAAVLGTGRRVGADACWYWQWLRTDRIDSS
ncbi:hypothetical protein JW905_02150 [bacterium]|nr:hypothetical protein [candidate division CSSED10-310 bacterium]